MADGILSLRDVRGVGLNPKDRHIMSDKLRSLFSNDWLDGLNDDQIYDLFEQYIERPGSNIYDLPIDDNWWELKPKPEPTEKEEI